MIARLPILVIERRRDICKACPESVAREGGRWDGRKFFCRRTWDGTQDRSQAAYLPTLTDHPDASCDRWRDSEAWESVRAGETREASYVAVKAGQPIDVDRLRALWAELHNRALAYAGDEAAEREWLEDFRRRVPCGVCRQHWQQITSDLPPDLSSADAYYAWTVSSHDAVNRLLGKPEWSLEEADVIQGSP